MSDAPRRVAVTGAAGYVGGRLIQRLEHEEAVEHILALDIRPLGRAYGPKVVYQRHDITEPIEDLLSHHGANSVVHLAFALKPSHDRASVDRVNVEAAERVFAACADGPVSHVLYLSSTTVYGAHPDNPPTLTEESPVRPVKGFQYGEAKAETERTLATHAERNPSLSTTVLRACPVLGPNADNFIAQAFSKPLLLGVRGFDPPLQLLHEDDLVDIMAHCVVHRTPGLYNLAGEGEIHWSEMTKIMGRMCLMVPSPLLYAVTGVTWALRLQSDSPPPGLDFIRYRWTVSTERIRRELGVTFRYSSRDTWESFARRKRALAAV